MNTNAHSAPLPSGQHRFHTMVKPAGSRCNLDCTYCYYLSKERLLDQPRSARIEDEVLEAHIRQYIEAHPAGEVVFSWQGGEPTLMGLQFFERVVDLQSRYAKPGQRIENDLQTNGVLLNDAWCSFLKRHNFLVGLSIDGPSSLHDVYRRNKGNRPTLTRVMAAVRLLRARKVPFTALCVVNKINAVKPLQVYRFLRDEVRPRVIQFIPCVEPVGFRSVSPEDWDWSMLPVTASPQARPGSVEAVVTDWSVDPEHWGNFLKQIWTEWFRRDYGRVHVDQFENVISALFGFGSQTCVTAEVCGHAMALEHNGDLFSCDHFVFPRYKLGNIMEASEGALATSARQAGFGVAKREALTRHCRACAYLPLCWGGCPKDRFVKAPDLEPGLNYLCPGLKTFYAQVVSDRHELRNRLA